MVTNSSLLRPNVTSSVVGFCAGSFVSLLGAAVLIGWAVDVAALKFVFSGLAPMRPNAAVGFLLAGASLSMLTLARPNQFSTSLSRTAAAFILLLGVLTLTEQIFGWNLQIDELLFRAPIDPSGMINPGRMSSISAAGFILLGPALLLLDRRYFFAAQILALAIMALSLIIFSGYLFGLMAFPSPGLAPPTAIHSALGFLLISLGLLVSSSASGFLPSVRTQLPAIGVACTLLLFGMSSIALFIDAQRMADTTSEVDEAHNVLGRLKDISLNFERVLTISRIFVLTGEEEFVAPLEMVNRQINADLTALRQTLAGDPDRLAMLASIDELVQRRLTLSNEYIGIRRRMGLQQTVDQIPAGGEQLATVVRTQITEMERTERIVLDQRRTNAAASHSTMTTTMIFFVSVSLIVLWFAIVTLRKQIKAQNKAEEDLRSSEARLNSFLAGAPDAFFVVNSQGEIQFVNAQVEHLLGYSVTEAMGRQFNTLIPEVGRNTRSGQFLDYFNNPDARSIGSGVEISAMHKDGSVIPVEISLNPLESEGEELVACAVRDITDRRRLQSQLQQAQKMEVVGQLTGGIAHDFNNLLAIILGNLQLIEESSKLDETLKVCVQAALDASFRGAKLTRRLLAFSRQQRLEPEIININTLVTAIAPLLKRTLGEEISLKTIQDNDLWLTEIDPSQLENSLLNLAVNAQSAMPGGGTLSVTTANATVDDTYRGSHTDIQPGEYVLVTVSDTGDGIAKDVLKKVFEPFFTTKEFGKGSGLGLSMVHGFIKQSKGHIDIETEVGHGANFKLFLPRADSATEYTSATLAPGTTLPTGRETILIVEDETAVRQIATKMLETFGYRVIEAGDGAEALALLNARHDIDLLFTDMVMPGGMSGAELVGHARKRNPNLKILYTSGYTAKGVRDSELTLSDEHVLNKPYLKEELAKAIRGSLGRAS